MISLTAKSCHNDSLIIVVFDKFFNTVKNNSFVIGSIYNAVPTISKTIQFIFGQQELITATILNICTVVAQKFRQ